MSFAHDTMISMHLSEHRVGELLSEMYSSEICIRIESFYDRGFVWYLLGPSSDAPRSLPRAMLDDTLDESAPSAIECTDELRNEVRAARLERDWVARGVGATVCEAVYSLAESIVKELPQSRFADWWLNGGWAFHNR